MKVISIPVSYFVATNTLYVRSYVIRCLRIHFMYAYTSGIPLISQSYKWGQTDQPLLEQKFETYCPHTSNFIYYMLVTDDIEYGCILMPYISPKWFHICQLYWIWSNENIELSCKQSLLWCQLISGVKVPTNINADQCDTCSFPTVHLWYYIFRNEDPIQIT